MDERWREMATVGLYMGTASCAAAATAAACGMHATHYAAAGAKHVLQTRTVREACRVATDTIRAAHRTRPNTALRPTNDTHVHAPHADDAQHSGDHTYGSNGMGDPRRRGLPDAANTATSGRECTPTPWPAHSSVPTTGHARHRNAQRPGWPARGTARPSRDGTGRRMGRRVGPADQTQRETRSQLLCIR